MLRSPYSLLLWSLRPQQTTSPSSRYLYYSPLCSKSHLGVKATEIKAPFLEQFTDGWERRWTPSEATKKTPVGGETFSYVGEWSVEEASTSVIEGDLGLVAKSVASHHAISAPFDESIELADKPLVVQYEVKYQKGGNCGGGYIKLLEDGFQTSGKEFSDKTPWVVMFGPDLTCPGTKVSFFFFFFLYNSQGLSDFCCLGSLHLPPQKPKDWRIRGEALGRSSQAFD